MQRKSVKMMANMFSEKPSYFLSNVLNKDINQTLCLQSEHVYFNQENYASRIRVKIM